MEVNHSSKIEGIHKYTGTLTFEFYGEPSLSTTDVFRYSLEDDFKEDTSFMLEGIKWESEPISIVTWQSGEYKNGVFTPKAQDDN